MQLSFLESARVPATPCCSAAILSEAYSLRMRMPALLMCWGWQCGSARGAGSGCGAWQLLQDMNLNQNCERRRERSRHCGAGLGDVDKAIQVHGSGHHHSICRHLVNCACQVIHLHAITLVAAKKARSGCALSPSQNIFTGPHALSWLCEGVCRQPGKSPVWGGERRRRTAPSTHLATMQAKFVTSRHACHIPEHTCLAVSA